MTSLLSISWAIMMKNVMKYLEKKPNHKKLVTRIEKKTIHIL